MISFFKVLDRTNFELFEKIANAFSLTGVELWTGLERLHELEIVDLEYEVARLSDQILGTYLFYKVFFKDQLADFSILLTGEFERHSHKIVDALNPLFNTFNAKLVIEKLRPSVKKRWNEIKDDETKALSFIKLFAHIDETEFLVYLKKKIDAAPQVNVEDSGLQFTPEKYQPFTNAYLDVLRRFNGGSVEIVLELIFDYLEKDLGLLPQVVHLLREDFCFDHYSHFWDYHVQQSVITKLIEKTNGESRGLYTRLLLAIAPRYLQMRFHSNSSTGMTVTVHTFPLRPRTEMVLI